MLFKRIPIWCSYFKINFEMLRLKRVVVLFGIFAVVTTVLLFLYSDEVCFEKFQQRQKIDGVCTNDLISVDGKNHTQFIEDFFDQRKVGKVRLKKFLLLSTKIVFFYFFPNSVFG